LAKQNGEIELWAISFSGLIFAVYLIFTRKPFWRGWSLAAAGVLLVTFYVHPPLWIGVVLVVGLLSGLIWGYRLSPAEK
jgi:hypothetical protein